MAEQKATRFVEFNDGLCVKFHPDVDYLRMGEHHGGFKSFRDMWETRNDFVRHKHGIGGELNPAGKQRGS